MASHIFFCTVRHPVASRRQVRYIRNLLYGKLLAKRTRRLKPQVLSYYTEVNIFVVRVAGLRNNGEKTDSSRRTRVFPMLLCALPSLSFKS
jgi:hypothetical protein